MKTKYRIWQWLRRLLILYVVMWVVTWAVNGPDAATIQNIAQIAIIIFLAIAQAILYIGGMMWFMARTKEEKILPGSPMVVTLDDYWGQPQIKELVRQWVALLKNPKEYVALGGVKPKGVLLSGPPGFGKSFLAKCLAGSANIPFISMDGSSLRSVWFGMGTVKVMMLFRRARSLAKQYGACIVFMDEIDSIGMTRGSGPTSMFGGGGGELNTLLYELDGKIPSVPFWMRPFAMVMELLSRIADRDWRIRPKESDDVVFFMGATNRPQVLDPALLRAGRLNRQIPVNKPDKTGRRDILMGYLKKIKSSLSSEEIEALTDDAGEMSPADIRQLVLEEATRKAHFRKSETVDMQDFQEAISEVYVGLRNPFRNLRPEERKALAVHEGGHAVLAWVLTDKRLQKVTIIRYGDALGHVAPISTVEVNLPSLRERYHDLVISMGGRAGEILKHEMMQSTGGDYPSVMEDIQKLLATGVWGTPVGTEKENSIRIRLFYDRGLMDAMALLQRYEDLHDKIVAALMERNELTHNEVAQLFGTRPSERLPMPEEPRDIIRAGGESGGVSSSCSSCG